MQFDLFRAGVELIEFDSFDDKKIPAFHYNPGVKGPCIISIHGGPAAQFVPSFLRSTHMDAHYYLANGIHIIGPNVRGSSGYQKSFIDSFKIISFSKILNSV